jgi:serine/threonine protein kinase
MEYRVDFLIKQGKGTFGEVWLGKIKRKEDFQTKFSAIKVAFNDEAKLLLKNESIIMQAIEKHPNIIEYI